MSAPIRYHETRSRFDKFIGRDVTYVLNRQCALCEHPTIEHDWLCTCCQSIDGRGGCSASVHADARIYGPLLPPHVPEHVWRALERGDGEGWSSPPPEGVSAR